MAPDNAATVPPSTILDSEVERFNGLAAMWWNSAGPMRPLHVINSLRLGYVLEQITRHLGRPRDNLQGLSIADVGCGAGLMCEPLARRGAQMTGVDAAAKNIAAAQVHARGCSLNIDYRVGEPAVALAGGELFDVVLLLEVVEHVDHLQTFMQQAASHLKPGGLLLVSTINRTARSFITAIVGAEYVFRLLPRGTHHWGQFVRPTELRSAALACGLVQQDCRGMGYLPAVHRAWWTPNLSVNYIASYSKPATQAPAH